MPIRSRGHMVAPRVSLIFRRPQLSTLKEVENLARQKMERVNVPWYITQHGIPHVERGVSCLESLLQIFPVSPAERRALMIAFWLHDIGQADFSIPAHLTRERHHIDGRRMVWELIEKGRLRLSEYEQHVVPELVFRHNMYTELPKERDLRRLVVLLRTADVSDLDRRRVASNDEGMPFDMVCRRIKDELDPKKANCQLKHWHGHRAILALNLYVSGNGAGARVHFEFSTADLSPAQHQIARFREKVAELGTLCREVCVGISRTNA